ncbi:translation initiation factor IF-2 [Succinivibrio dextrinosolvens]|uniref:translation initiation factor IF-2 n=1 Tax=Succinivibrio dextrinosolvens TaxID=83771 RepID=UPI0004E1EA8E|nr:translation initiation factor IF-2 [Succinivibrio dextrinosolvens]
MSEEKEQTGAAPKRMSLKKSSSSNAAMQGTKKVQVEVRKKKIIVDPKARKAQLEAEALEKKAAEEQAAKEEQERKAKEAAEKAAAKAAAEKQQKAPEEKSAAKAEVKVAATKVAVKPKSAPAPHKEKEEDKATAELRKAQEEQQKRKSEEEAKRLAEQARKLAEENEARWAAEEAARASDDDEDDSLTSQYVREAEARQEREAENRGRHRDRSGTDRRGSNKRFEEAEQQNNRRQKGGKAGKGVKGAAKLNQQQHGFNRPAAPVSRDVEIGETITVADLAAKMAVKATEVIKCLMKLGEMVTINQVLDQSTAQVVAEEMGHKVILRKENEIEEQLLRERGGSISEATMRAPVVTIMGHVDHGKTSLLDYIRKSKVAVGEAGGITQRIGAYHVETRNNGITFLDTPGHAAFTAMRARGAQCTDIVVLVVAADDGVMPQTLEAIQHAQAAKVPMIVAINKMDKPGADPQRVINELMQHSVIPESMGGENQFVEVSAKTGMGVDELLEAITLQAEVLELKAVHDGMAEGVTIESRLDKGRGPVATVLVRSGTLHKGDTILCGLQYGRVRAMRNEKGQELTEAGPSIPVEVFGLSGVPSAGDEVTAVSDEKKAREVALFRQGKFRELKIAKQKSAQLASMFKESNASELKVVLKADTQGSVEAISDALLKLGNEEVQVKIIGSGVGGITANDATLAAADSAVIIGFNVRADGPARQVIDSESVDLHYYSVIYDLIDDVKKAMSGLLKKEVRENFIGYAEVRDVFRHPKYGAIAGCMVVEGVVKRSAPIRVLRDNTVIFEGELDSLRRFKDDVSEVKQNNECGICVKNYQDVRVGDRIEVFEKVEVARTLD